VEQLDTIVRSGKLKERLGEILEIMYTISDLKSVDPAKDAISKSISTVSPNS
jgi:hypothetical protein